MSIEPKPVWSTIPVCARCARQQLPKAVASLAKLETRRGVCVTCNPSGSAVLYELHGNAGPAQRRV